MTSIALEAEQIRHYDSVFGRVRDTDSHEMYPAKLWAEEFGREFQPVADLYFESQSAKVPNSFTVDRVTDDDPITSESMQEGWGSGCLAPSAFNLSRRMDFMDLAGIVDSLVFGSSMAILGLQIATASERMAQQRGRALPFDGPTMGRAMLAAHNDWCMRVAALSPRLRPVATIITDTLQGALSEIQRMHKSGVRTISIPAGEPIEGRAPCHPLNDALWGYCADNDITIALHVGGERGFIKEATAWTNAPQFATNNDVPTELPLNPFSFAISSQAVQVYLTNIVLGGVFERIPNLRMGLMEMGGYWLGAAASNMDMWADQFRTRMSKIISKRPTEYIHRNIRCSPFHFEPVDEYIRHFPFLQDVLCFSTDFPHFEGGKNPREVMAEKVGALGSGVVEKYFVTNAEWIMPNAG